MPETKSIRRIALWLTGLSLAASAVAQDRKLSPAEEQVWRLEEKYWRCAQAYDLPGYAALWHKRFVGWPSAEATPVGKSSIGGWLERRRSAGQSLQYELRREAVRQIDGPVVMHHSVTMKWTGKDGKTEAEQARITHTWLNEKETWKIAPARK